ncbi:hypothetical protein CMK11_12690 [Candidatus Poribacteria bacterium]|nr:hypothetical protein [Candidatus Poribacteria bacterium]
MAWDVLLFVVFTRRRAVTWIISARRATRKEVAAYYVRNYGHQA